MTYVLVDIGAIGGERVWQCKGCGCRMGCQENGCPRGNRGKKIRRLITAQPQVKWPCSWHAQGKAVAQSNEGGGGGGGGGGRGGGGGEGGEGGGGGGKGKEGEERES